MCAAGSHVLWNNSACSSHSHSGWEAESLGSHRGEPSAHPSGKQPEADLLCSQLLSQVRPVLFLPEGLLGFLARSSQS